MEIDGIFFPSNEWRSPVFVITFVIFEVVHSARTSEVNSRIVGAANPGAAVDLITEHVYLR